MTSSNFVACTIGKSSGFGALEHAAGINAHLSIRVSKVASVAHEPTNFGVVTLCIRGREQALD